MCYGGYCGGYGGGAWGWWFFFFFLIPIIFIILLVIILCFRGVCMMPYRRKTITTIPGPAVPQGPVLPTYTVATSRKYPKKIETSFIIISLQRILDTYHHHNPPDYYPNNSPPSDYTLATSNTVQQQSETRGPYVSQALFPISERDEKAFHITTLERR
uniref:Vesicular, overexpressed in cancer, prosurvival protein 1 n=1 Tax=Panagrellus redivivus TaxID=6233 RepID=A0A7E4UXS3_PANRE